jgi:hypothetical protein
LNYVSSNFTKSTLSIYRTALKRMINFQLKFKIETPNFK